MKILPYQKPPICSLGFHIGILTGIGLSLFVGASASSAQTPWEATPATPQRPLYRAEKPPGGQPPMIPFDPNAKFSFQAIDLPPPNTPSSNSYSAVGSNSTANEGSKSKIQKSAVAPQMRLPDASQLLPRSPLNSGNSPDLGSGPSDVLLGIPPIPEPTQLHSGSTNQNGFDITSSDSEATNAGIPGSLVGFSSRTIESAAAVTTSFNASQLIAIVGTERVLAGDLAPIIEPIIQENLKKIPSKLYEEEIRQKLVREALPQYVEVKALAHEFFRDMAGNVPPTELRKMRDQVTTRASRMFYDRYVPMELFKRYKVEDLAELDQKLRESGLSVALLKNHFLTQVLAAQLEEKYVSDTYEIPPQEILDYYQQHIERWQIPARAKWRQLTVRFDRHSTRSDVEGIIRQLGNEVVLGGKPFDAVAKHSSEGFTAADGGMHDWTFEGSLKSELLDKAIFGLPLNRLSDLIEDDVGIHIIEVLQRESARTKDMAEIQTEIRKILSDQIREKKAEEFREKILDRVVVWTRWPEDIPGSRPLEEALGDFAP